MELRVCRLVICYCCWWLWWLWEMMMMVMANDGDDDGCSIYPREQELEQLLSIKSSDGVSSSLEMEAMISKEGLPKRRRELCGIQTGDILCRSG